MILKKLVHTELLIYRGNVGTSRAHRAKESQYNATRNAQFTGDRPAAT